MPVPVETRFASRRSGMYRKRVASQDEVYRMMSQRPVSSTLSPYVPLPAIGSRFRSGTSRSLPGPRSQRAPGDVLARRESDPLARFDDRELNRNGSGSREVTPLSRLGLLRQGSSERGLSDKRGNSAGVDGTDKEPFGKLERERTYDVLEPRFVHRVGQEGDDPATDERASNERLLEDGSLPEGEEDDVFGAKVPCEETEARTEAGKDVDEQLGRALKAIHLDKPQAFWLEL